MKQKYMKEKKMNDKIKQRVVRFQLKSGGYVQFNETQLSALCNILGMPDIFDWWFEEKGQDLIEV